MTGDQSEKLLEGGEERWKALYQMPTASSSVSKQLRTREEIEERRLEATEKRKRKSMETELETELDLNPQFVDIAKQTETILSEVREDRAQKKKNQQKGNQYKRNEALGKGQRKIT